MYLLLYFPFSPIFFLGFPETSSSGFPHMFWMSLQSSVSFLSFPKNFLRPSLTVLSRLGCSGVTSAHCYLCLPGTSNYPASTTSPPQPLITSWDYRHLCHGAWLIFVFLVEMGFHHVGQAGLEFLTSGDAPALASQSAGITDVSHSAWPSLPFQCLIPMGWHFPRFHFLFLQPTKKYKNVHISFIYYSKTCKYLKITIIKDWLNSILLSQSFKIRFQRNHRRK